MLILILRQLLLLRVARKRRVPRAYVDVVWAVRRGRLRVLLRRVTRVVRGVLRALREHFRRQVLAERVQHVAQNLCCALVEHERQRQYVFDVAQQRRHLVLLRFVLVDYVLDGEGAPDDLRRYPMKSLFGG